MSHTKSPQFHWVGQFSAFVAGEKSPNQYLTMQVAATDCELTEDEPSESIPCQVQLSSALRRMMIGYLQPQDWIRVIGKVTIESQTGIAQWKAREIVKISPQQATQYVAKHASSSRPTQPPTQPGKASEEEACQTFSQSPTRVLVCQKSSCRQRGSQRVIDAIAHVINTHGQSATIKLQPTGCMKQCQSGPHIVLVPPNRQPSLPQPQSQQKRTRSKFTCVTPQLAAQILESQINQNQIS
ncbi:MAG: (2Fe-2S) ferredoxin domain-containing protein [Cyanobacteria bacterium J06634_6]